MAEAATFARVALGAGERNGHIQIGSASDPQPREPLVTNRMVGDIVSLHTNFTPTERAVSAVGLGLAVAAA